MIITTQVGGIPINRLNESSGCSPSVGKSGGASCVGPDGAPVSGGDAGAGNSSTLHLCCIAFPLETRSRFTRRFIEIEECTIF